VVAWLRARGLTEEIADKPCHLLRKIYIDAMRNLASARDDKFGY